MRMTRLGAAGRFTLLWVLCPLIALATLRVMFGGIEAMMAGFAYHMDLRPLAFQSHIFLASVALALVPFQFWHGLRRRNLPLHRTLGRIYALAILISGLGGLVLAMGTESGPVAAWGFGLLALAWMGATGWGVVLAIRSQVARHRAWMIRSAALTMAAVSLRLQLAAGAAMGIDYPQMAGFVAWSCWLPNLLIAEAILRRPVARTGRIVAPLGTSVGRARRAEPPVSALR